MGSDPAGPCLRTCLFVLSPNPGSYRSPDIHHVCTSWPPSPRRGTLEGVEEGRGGGVRFRRWYGWRKGNQKETLWRDSARPRGNIQGRIVMGCCIQECEESGDEETEGSRLPFREIEILNHQDSHSRCWPSPSLCLGSPGMRSRYHPVTARSVIVATSALSCSR